MNKVSKKMKKLHARNKRKKRHEVLKGGELFIMSDGFLPSNYEGVPEAPSSYMKLEEGENRFRVLSSAVVGWEYWEEDDQKNRKVVRVRTVKDVPAERLSAKDSRQRARHFWAFTVFNYKSASIQILELKQAGLMKGLESLVKNPKWGSPKEYDIVITKTKTGSNAFDVEYAILPDPKEKVDADILKLQKEIPVNLEALFSGKNPFDPKADEEVRPEDIPDDLGAH